MLLRIFNPEVFQGNLKKKHYFEGWYFKHVTSDPVYTFAFIPGISLTENDSHAFVQFLDGSTGNTYYSRYPLSDFKWDKKSLFLSIGSSVFTDKGITLDIDDDNLKLSGRIEYSNMIKYPVTFFSPGIMGWYSFVPFMECYHGIVSVSHNLSGKISFNSVTTDLKKGKGYIEKDWGKSFPEAWIWIQSNNFGEHDTSFSFSIAKIPWLGKYFIGFISFLYCGKKFYLFSTYNNSAVSNINIVGSEIEITVSNRNYILKISVTKKSFGDLSAPVSGRMSRKIRESVDSELHLKLYDKFHNLKYEGEGKNVGLEIIEEIFGYI